MVTVRPAGFAVELSLQGMCELDGNSTELTSVSRKALYAAVNERLNNLHVTFFSHSLSDLSSHITDDNQLKEVFAIRWQTLPLIFKSHSISFIQPPLLWTKYSLRRFKRKIKKLAAQFPD